MKKFTIILMLALMVSVATASKLPFHNVQVLDEVGEKVTTISSVEIYAPGTTTNAVIYSDRALQNVITIPMTTGSTNTTLSNGNFFWYGPDGYDYAITDGSNLSANADHRTRSSSEGRIIFPTYLTAISSTSYSDSQSATWGTGLDVVNQWINGASALRWTPAADGSKFDIGVSGTGSNMDFNVFVGTALGLKLDEGAATLIIDGLTTSINTSSNFATNINTGTSTGAVTIGSSTSGTLALDTTTGMTINADDSIGMTTSGGSADITVDALAGSVIIDGGEAVDDAVVIKSTGAAGGIDITSLGDIDITTTGAAGEDITIINTGGSITITATEAVSDALTIGTSAAGGDVNIDAILGSINIEAEEDAANAILIIADGGTTSGIILLNDTGTGDESILLDSDLGGITLNANDGSIDIEAVGGTNGDIILDSGDDMTFTVAGDLVFAVTGDTTFPNDMLRKATVAIADTEMDNLAATPKELVAAVAGSTIEFVSAIIALDWGSTAWTEPSAPDDLVIRYTNGSGAIVSQLLDATGFATATEDTVAFLTPTVANAAGAAVASVAVTEAASTNKGLFLHNTGSEWTNSGDSQVVVITYYRLHTTAELGL